MITGKQDDQFVVAIIPARAGSKGVPGKNTRPLAGRSLLERACDCALQSRLIDRTIVSTDCPRTAAMARAAGADVPFLRPAALAADNTPMLNVIEHAVDWMRDHEDFRLDVVALLQPTTPLRTPEHIDEALSQLLANDADSIVSVCRLDASLHPDWQLRIDDGKLTTFAGRDLSQLATRRQLLSVTYKRNGALYAVRTEALLATRSIYGQRCLAYEMPAEISINIDTPQDWAAAETAILQTRAMHEAA